MRLALCNLVLASVAVTATAQATYPVGSSLMSWRDVPGASSTRLDAYVMYPATAAGVDQPVFPVSGGWPVVVFLHGFGLVGSDYHALGAKWAETGLVVVMLQSGQWNYHELRADALAAIPALQIANTTPGSALLGALDTSRIGLAGHSMGGGVAGLVLRREVGYRCGIALAPVSPGSNVPRAIGVPFGLVVGTGDLVTPWQAHAQPYYQALAATGGMKFLYLLDGTCDHMNIVGLTGSLSGAVFTRTASVTAGFFGHLLRRDPFALEECVGPTAQAEPHLVSLAQSVVVPQQWGAESLRLGTVARISVGAEPGEAGIVAADYLSLPFPTLYGALLVNPATASIWTVGSVGQERRFDAWLDVPNQSSLVGMPVALQSFSSPVGQPITLGTAIQLQVVP